MNLETVAGRKAVIDHIESNANLGRKAQSYKASEILNDRIKPYVIEELRNQFSEDSVKEIPVISSVNIAKRVVNQLACIYKDAPVRQFTELSEDQLERVELVYRDMMANKKLNLSNKIFKNHDQCLLQIIPKDGRLIMRALKPHQWDCVPMEDDPERAKAYIISSYDNYSELLEDSKNPAPATGYQSMHAQNTENYKNQKAIDAQEKRNKRYLIWTVEESYFCDGNGNMIGEPTPNPLAQFGVMPFVEISAEKEFEYWVRAQNTFASFTVEFCASMSSVAQVVKLQGFAQAILKGNPELLPTNLQIGPNHLLFLPTDPNAGVDTDFQFANPGSDINGSLAYLETLLTTFLSSNGIDPKTISMNGEGQSYTSGLERLLAMIEKVSASREDYDTFERVEEKVWYIVKAWLNALSNSETLDQKYRTSQVPMDSRVVIEFAAPEMVKSDMEELEVISREIELGISSPVNAIMQREGLSREEAEEKYQLYLQENIGMPRNQEV